MELRRIQMKQETSEPFKTLEEAKRALVDLRIDQDYGLTLAPSPKAIQRTITTLEAWDAEACAQRVMLFEKDREIAKLDHLLKVRIDMVQTNREQEKGYEKLLQEERTHTAKLREEEEARDTVDSDEETDHRLLWDTIKREFPWADQNDFHSALDSIAKRLHTQQAALVRARCQRNDIYRWCPERNDLMRSEWCEPCKARAAQPEVIVRALNCPRCGCETEWQAGSGRDAFRYYHRLEGFGSIPSKWSPCNNSPAEPKVVEGGERRKPMPSDMNELKVEHTSAFKHAKLIGGE